jgi:hypothetical protein
MAILNYIGTAVLLTIAMIAYEGLPALRTGSD